MALITTRLLSGFDDALCSHERWQRLLDAADTNVVFLTKRWLQAWWETLGDGALLLIAAERGGEIAAIAPLYSTEGMVFFLGAGESDYLDFIGPTSDPAIIAALLETARQLVPNFLGFRLHLVPDRSSTGKSLQAAAERLGLDCLDEAELPSVEIELAAQPDAIRRAVNGSMLKRENYCRRNGTLEVRHFSSLTEIQSHLKEYYAQHEERWRAKALPSQFSDLKQRAFLERFLELAVPSDWIRFLRIDWNGLPFAFEFAWYYGGTFYPGPWCFAVEFSRQSPGQILMRQSVLAALEHGLGTYDLGGGDQEYKLRLPAKIHYCRTWGLYPS